jgi:23S rRNA pseudouridine1911/1915/1917 synthase
VPKQQSLCDSLSHAGCAGGINGSARYNSLVEHRAASVPRGVTWRVTTASAGVRVDKFLAATDRLGSRSRVVTALDKGQVFLNEREITRAEAGSLLRPGDDVRLWRDRPGSATRRHVAKEAGDIVVLHDDEAMLVVSKPAGLLSVPLERKAEAGSVYDQLETYLRSHGKRRPLVVHRIDRDTSGLVIFAKTRRAQDALKDQFRRHEVERVYLTVVYGCPVPREGAWSDHLVWDTKALIQKETSASDPRGKLAVSRYRVLEEYESTSLLEVELETGKRNQIRLQARLRGHTLVGERRYTYGPESLRPVAFGRQALHAYRLSFRHPVDDRRLTFEAPLPADMTGLLARLRRSRP